MASAAPPSPPEAPPEEVGERVVTVRRRPWLLSGWRRWIIAFFLAVAGIIAIGLLTLESPIGHRFVVDRIAKYAPASGLRVQVGRFEGSLFGEAVLRDVRFSDPQGLFMRVPVIEVDWRPLHWFTSGLDVRKLILRRGTLYRGPRLKPGEPDAPILPDFDIRVDRFEFDRLTVARGMMGEQRRIDLVAKADIRKGRALLETRAQLGGQDRLYGKLDSEPKADRFDIALDYNAPKGGFLATLMGAEESIAAKVNGAGRYADWRGRALVTQPKGAIADLAIGNRAGLYSVAGQVHPAGFVSGVAARATGPTVVVNGEGRLASSVLTGKLATKGQGAEVKAAGAIDLAGNAFRALKLDAVLRDPELLGKDLRLEDARLAATVDGPFRRLTIDHRITARRFVSGKVRLDNPVQQGRIVRADTRWTLPLALTTGRIVTGNSIIDPRLTKGSAKGAVVVVGNHVHADELVIGAPGVGAALALDGSLQTGDSRLTGPVAARGLALSNLGLADADLKLTLGFGKSPWNLAAAVRGRMTSVSNPTLTTLAGTGIKFGGNVAVGGNRPMVLRGVTVNGSALSLMLDGRLAADGSTTVAGSGRHTRFGAFTVDARLADDGPHAVLVFARPLPAAGLRDVRVALAPIPQGFRIETSGQSTLGPFAGTLGLFSPPGGPTRIEIEKLDVWKTAVSGTLVLGSGGADGKLALTGGGLDGTITLAPRGGGQGFAVALVADHASFGGTTPIAIGMARIDATGTIVDGHTSVTGKAYAEGVQQGSLFIGRLSANAALTDGSGRITASLSGRRGSRFNLNLLADLAPDRYAVLAGGDFAGQTIAMPRRAVLTRAGEGWELAPTELDYAGGRLQAQGTIGPMTTLNLRMADMPLALVDVLTADLGLGGKASGEVTWRTVQDGPPSADARLEIKGLSRSGLVLTSRPVDLSLVAKLEPNVLEARATVRDGSAALGRLQGRVEGLAPSGTLWDRLAAGRLFAQLRYSGPADALWRLAALETFDLTGPINVAADFTGTLADPEIRGSLASTGLRLQSAQTGTDIQAITARGTFAGSRLQISSFAGRAGSGQVSGSGQVDLSNMGNGRGPGIDIRLAARNAALIARDDMAATVTGPLRIVSDGMGGTIAGRLSVESARWNLGRATAATELPNVKTREINPRADVAPVTAPAAPWRYLVDASAPSHVDVRGLGLDSEWSADLKIRGTTASPSIVGRAELVRGGYDFAGKRFDLTRGLITFDGDSPPDPRLDIAATADMTGLTATVTVTGTASKPTISFTSVPSLPEEELLSRLLFGSSITQISAPEAVQIGAALAALRGGGGLDPINKLRTAIGLDRLRILGADAATGRGTSVAVGKYIGRRLYAEVVSDGRGYNATQLEYRVTRWLSIIATISSIGRQGADVKVSKDY
ncbi:translocation/assembly module TamB domain-containing protein [Novosphingobium flavum]|uniref:Translocation/assembly module TamB domain-containing protein n=1 Tax=Novosphingobium flavum TaxID=1778672 RepID=A0A7X1FS54_9SPHN|nr:translocation/assembly module TamB domain-containing protein [Novosphingobium flavum]MBC2665974.1 translocation/assembly module TamB domain-containing protein [Novosphingobium flavum]